MDNIVPVSAAVLAALGKYSCCSSPAETVVELAAEEEPLQLQDVGEQLLVVEPPTGACLHSSGGLSGIPSWLKPVI